MRSFLLACASLVIGYLWGWVSCAIRQEQRNEIDKTLKDYAEFQRRRDLQFPEMIGKWGKP